MLWEGIGANFNDNLYSSVAFDFKNVFFKMNEKLRSEKYSEELMKEGYVHMQLTKSS